GRPGVQSPHRAQYMKILSIETSCDDTGISILQATGKLKNLSFKVLADSLAIQDHAQYGGVFPMMAKKEHLKNLPILLEKVLKKTKLNKKTKPVDAIAVTYGPGLEPCLWTGIVLAQELSEKWGVPVVPTNHMEGHILSVFGKTTGQFKFPKVEFPALALLVSGGHTELVLVKDFGKYKIIGKTLDDAAGEAFDKVARMMGLPYPGGPHISKLAHEARLAQERSSGLSFPRPMLHSKNLDFSFSGLKTAVLYYIQKNKSYDKAEVAMEFENAVVDTLIHKTKKAIEEYKIKTMIVAGGVAANKHLKSEMQKLTKNKIKLYFPTRELSRDNALMIGIAGYLNYVKKSGRFPKASKIKATGNLQL
ncbi:MAG: tRNA (adenosine(37)-N6)-threonylcarbamoyltransferase complex transferase subunit TsaD, partial [Candidatus Pacebacteria bacterium]|nr:tRNA (adenosine(37)-N6)-threonylcarbamoyltransferase complex transferase subunit TsaD [Candidatus Paceibacterota bacterium]